MGLSGLSGLQGTSGIQPAVSASSSIVNWSLMPNVPTSRRSEIETALTNAAAGQSYTEQEIFDTLRLSSFYFSYEVASLYTDREANTPATANGDIILAAKDWKAGAVMISPLDSGVSGPQTPTLTSNGVEFDNGDQLDMTANPFSVTDFTYFIVAQLVSPTTGGGGEVMGVGNIGGSGIMNGLRLDWGNSGGFGDSSRLLAGHVGVTYGVVGSPIANNNKILVSTLRSGSTTTVQLNGVQVRSSISSYSSWAGTPGVFVGNNYNQNRGSFTRRVQAFMTFNAALTVSQRSQITQFMTSYYQLN
jgi:hypothetical protein